MTTKEIRSPLALTIALAAICALLQGCVVAAVGVGVGAVKAGKAKQKDAYANYLTEMEKVNLEREKANLQLRPIMSYDEWQKGGTNVPHMARPAADKKGDPQLSK